MNGRAIPGAYLFRPYVCDKEMSSPHHIGETHQPEWVVYVRDSEKFRLTNVIPERIIFVSRGITVLITIKWEPYYLLRNHPKNLVKKKGTSHFIQQIQLQAATCLVNVGGVGRKNIARVNKRKHIIMMK